jgi:RNA polymerase sigma-70 factor (ECF subfamily)
MSGQPMASAVTVLPVEQPADRVAALFDLHYPRVYLLARRLTSSADEARDLVQDTFLRAARSPQSVPFGTEREEAWLVRVAVNIRRDQWRHAATRVRHRQQISPLPEVQPDHGSEVIAKTTIWRALDLLPPRRRAVIIMRELEGMAVSAIASQLGITAITVRWHLSAARRQLTRVLTAESGAKP